MKNLTLLVMVLGFIGVGICHGQPRTNRITTPDPFFTYAYSVNGSPATNPVIELVAGAVNILEIDTDPIHPVVVTTNGDVYAWYTDANPQNQFDQPIAVSAPASGFPTTLYYLCYYHYFGGEIHFSLPSSPSPNTILEIRVGTNVVMISTGTTTTWNLVPEFSSNLVSGTWAAVPNYTNSFANGTNTTVFNRLDPFCGPNVFFRLRQEPPN